jgi:ATP-dependent Lon protease
METREDPAAQAAGAVEIANGAAAPESDHHGGAELDDGAIQVPDELSLLPLKEHVLFPAMVAPLTVTREASIKLVDDAAVANNRVIGVVTLRDPNIEQSGINDIYPVGTAAAIRMMVKMPDGVRLIVQGLSRIQVNEATQTEPYLRAHVSPVEDTTEYSPEQLVEVQAMARNLGAAFQKVVQMSPNLPDELQAIPMNVSEPGVLADLIAAHLPVPVEEKEEILAEPSVRERLRRLTALMSRELNVLEVGNRIQSEVAGEMSRMQREYYLREQLKAIQKELGEADERTAETEELRQRIEEAHMPEEVQKEALRELDRLAKMPPAAAEYTVIRTYIDWLIALPWDKGTVDNLDIPAVRRVLDEDHYGLEKIKDRILEYLSVKKFKPAGEVRHPILCFVGPPGVGKTSLGRSIARAVGRKFVRISLGGVRDEAEIRGHRRTYIGAMPGQIIQGIRRAESHNPVFMLDEIDKLGSDFRGDPSSALLEVLDPEQNRDFRDHYLDVPFDLSRVMFITTANMLDTIPPPLRDRMEIVELAGYTEEEKLEIANRHLIPKQLGEHGMGQEMLVWTEEGTRLLIRGYTREAGVRSLEREIAAVTRKATRQFAEGRAEPVTVNREQVIQYLGSPRFEYEEVLDRVSRPGVATGLAWTPAGGDVLFVEATAMPGGRGSLTITGQIGDVMRESAQAALTYVRSRAEEIGIPDGFFRRHDLHIHVPAGAIPKDGPSAGITMATAIASVASGRKVRPRLAMTGEITLTGRVLPVGGIKEKVLAARRAGIREIILSDRNRRDVHEDVPEQVKADLSFHYVTEVDDVFHHALEPTPEQTVVGEERELVPSP